MSSPTRWDPIRDVTSLRDAMSQLMEQAVMRPGYNPWALQGSGYGQMNVFEANGKYTCQVLLPGVSSDDIELTVRQNTLAIKVAVPEPVAEEQRKNATYLLREFGAGEFTRAITFPKDVNADAVEANYEHGMLTIAVPLAQHAQPRRISVRGAGAKSQKQIKQSQQQYVESRQPAAVGGETGPNGRRTEQNPSAY